MPQNPKPATINDVAFCYEPVGGAWYDEAIASMTLTEGQCLVPIFRYQTTKVVGGVIISSGITMLVPKMITLVNNVVNSLNIFFLNSDIRVSWAVLWSIHGSTDPIEQRLYLIALAALTSAGILSANDTTGWIVKDSNSNAVKIIAETGKSKIPLYFTSEARAAEFNADVFGFSPGKVAPI